MSAAVAYSLSLEQATTGVIVICPNVFKSSASINSRPTERQNYQSTEFKFKCKFTFEFKFLDWLVFTTVNNILCDSWMAQTLSACYRVKVDPH